MPTFVYVFGKKDEFIQVFGVGHLEKIERELV